MGKAKSPKESQSSPPKSKGEPEARKEIPLVSVPNDREMIAEEMAELFEEDEVTHKHGDTEPEAD